MLEAGLERFENPIGRHQKPDHSAGRLELDQVGQLRSVFVRLDDVLVHPFLQRAGNLRLFEQPRALERGHFVHDPLWWTEPAQVEFEAAAEFENFGDVDIVERCLGGTDHQRVGGTNQKLEDLFVGTGHCHLGFELRHGVLTGYRWKFVSLSRFCRCDGTSDSTASATITHIRSLGLHLETARLSMSMQFELKILQNCWFLAGPTACGKTEVSIRLASRLNAEIVSLDSMALYRGMDVGTAKPSDSVRRNVRHHLIDILDPHEEFSLADYVSAAETCCREILQRDRVPLFVGGTGLYLRGVLRGVFEGPPADWHFRAQLEQEAEQLGSDALYRRLCDIDPDAAQSLHPRDIRRVIRALEVHHQTGQPLSQQQQERALPPDDRPQHVFWLHPPRDWLYERVN